MTTLQASVRRGRTVIAGKVIEKIAAQAATEIDEAGGRRGGLLGFGSQADLGARPEVKAELVGRTAQLHVKAALAYPASIAASAQRVRDHLGRRLAELAGVDLTRCDIEVVMLARTVGPRGPR